MESIEKNVLEEIIKKHCNLELARFKIYDVVEQKVKTLYHLYINELRVYISKIEYFWLKNYGIKERNSNAQE